ncbi:MAG: glycosyltransferase family 1 protein [bacterium]
MKVGILLSPFGGKEPTGLNRMIFGFTKAIVESNRENECIIYLKKKPDVMPVFSGNNWKIKVVGFGCLWKEIGLFFAPKSDVYIFNTPIIPFLFRPKKSVVIVADFAYKYFKEEGFKKRLKRILLHSLASYSLKRSDKIVSISDFTKKEVIKFFNISDSKIEVIYPGFKSIRSVKPFVSNIKKPYFLAVGGTKERKNTFGLAKAFCLFKEKYGFNHKLVIAGTTGGDYFNKILNLIKQSNLEKDVIFFNFANDEKLSYLYNNAEALVFPSLLEGFGFPVLEAMDSGLPVITSNDSSLPEAAKGAALLIDPRNSVEISEAMYKIASDKVLKNELIKKGLERCKEISWQKTGEEFSKLLNSL